MLVPLAVRLKTAKADRLLSSAVKSLKYRSVAQGGFASATFSLHRPLALDSPEIDLYADVQVIDTRDGTVEWEGRLEDPGRGLGSDGQVWDLTAIGPSAHLEDRTQPLSYCTQDLTIFQKFGGSMNGSDISVEDVGSSSGLKTKLPSGTAVAQYAYAAAYTLALQYAGLELARVSFKVVGGGTSSDWHCQFYTYPSQTLLTDAYLSTTTSDLVTWTLDDWVAGDYGPHFRLERYGTATTPDDNAYALWSSVTIRCTLLHEWGVALDAADYTEDYVLAHEVVADLIGRVLDQYDGAYADIDDTSTVQIDELSYPAGATAKQVLDDLAELVPTHTFAAWEKNPLTGKHRVIYRPWPTTVRYLADVVDGYSGPGSAADLYNAVTVKWKDYLGRYRATRVTSSVPQLTAAGLTRESSVDLGDTASSTRNATSAGAAFLEEHAVPVNAGTLTIGRPILDLATGRRVAPHKIRPGELIRVAGVNPHPDSLNATGRDGYTVFRISSAEFDSDAGTASLELDSYDRTTAAALRKLNSAHNRRR